MVMQAKMLRIISETESMKIETKYRNAVFF